jgi:2-polyprenyl-3-methyl-5-hydroxy-6-metoxy-1,4-benzoquinol methylase
MTAQESQKTTSAAAVQTYTSLERLGELYHDYSVFRARNKQISNFVINQKCKQPILTAYIAYAIAKSQQTYNSNVTFLEMFCADGFFAMLARQLGATKSCGMDSNKDGWSGKSQAIAEALSLENVSFIVDDVNNLDKHGNFDIIANIGGLYHVSNPEEILLASYRSVNKYLIVQTVVNLNKNSRDYFESPAPGWRHGSRFSRESFDRLIKKHRFKVMDQHFNILEGNERPEDRGSVYYLIEKEERSRLRWW